MVPGEFKAIRSRSRLACNPPNRPRLRHFLSIKINPIELLNDGFTSPKVVKRLIGNYTGFKKENFLHHHDAVLQEVN